MFCSHLYPRVLLRSINSNYVSDCFIQSFVYGSSGIANVFVNNENVFLSELRDVSDGILNEKTQLTEQLSTLTEEKEKLIQGNCFVQTSKGSSMNHVTVLRGRRVKDFMTTVIKSVMLGEGGGGQKIVQNG